MIRLFALTLAAAASLTLAVPAQAGPATSGASLHLAQYGGGYGGDYRRDVYPRERYRRDWNHGPAYRGGGYGSGYGGGYGYQAPVQPTCYWEVRRVRVYVPQYARDVWQRQRVRVCN